MGFERLTHKPYKRHFICLNCRKGFKRPPISDMKNEEDAPSLCPQCRQPMVLVAYTFEVPKQSDKKVWKELEERYKK